MRRLAEVNPEAYARATAAAGEESRSGCDIFAALEGPAREAFFRANMFPDSTVRAKVDSVDVAHGLRNTGELSRALFASGFAAGWLQAP